MACTVSGEPYQTKRVEPHQNRRRTLFQDHVVGRVREIVGSSIRMEFAEARSTDYRMVFRFYKARDLDGDGRRAPRLHDKATRMRALLDSFPAGSVSWQDEDQEVWFRGRRAGSVSCLVVTVKTWPDQQGQWHKAVHQFLASMPRDRPYFLDRPNDNGSVTVLFFNRQVSDRYKDVWTGAFLDWCDEQGLAYEDVAADGVVRAKGRKHKTHHFEVLIPMV